MVVSTEQIRNAIDSLISGLDGNSANITFANVLKQYPALNQAYNQVDSIFGSGNVAPTAETPAGSIADFAIQYLDEHSIDALAKTKDSVIAEELYGFYMKKFTTGLYGLFSSVQEINRKYGGLDPDANQISDQIIKPSFISISTTQSVPSYSLPSGVTGSIKTTLAQPAVRFANTVDLSVASTLDAIPAVPVGWVNHYFDINSSISAGELYGTASSGSPALDKNTAFVVFGMLDRQGNIDGIKYANAKDNFTKPVYFGHNGMNVDGNGTVSSATYARVLNNGMSMYIGQSTYGYAGIDVNDSFASRDALLTTSASYSASVSVNVDLLGIMFATAPIIQNSLY